MEESADWSWVRRFLGMLNHKYFPYLAEKTEPLKKPLSRLTSGGLLQVWDFVIQECRQQSRLMHHVIDWELCCSREKWMAKRN